MFVNKIFMNYTYIGWLIIQILIAVLLLVRNKGSWGKRKIVQFALVLLCVIVTVICMLFDAPMWIPVLLFSVLALLDLCLERKARRTL